MIKYIGMSGKQLQLLLTIDLVQKVDKSNLDIFWRLEIQKTNGSYEFFGTRAADGDFTFGF